MLLRWHQVTLIDTSHEAGPTGEETLYKAEPETAWRHNDKDNRATGWVALVTIDETRQGQIAPVHPFVMPPSPDQTSLRYGVIG